MRAKKHLGQHFLTSARAVADMVEAAKVTQDDTVLEIGPGRGVLTRALLETGATVVAIEMDSDMIPILTEEFAPMIKAGKFILLHGDATSPEMLAKLTLPAFAQHHYKLVANIPYYITGLILRTYICSTLHPSSATVLVQKEVAELVVAKDGREGILSIAIKVFGVPEKVAIVKAGSFSPPPKVDSAILHIGDITTKKLQGLPESTFFTLLRAGFASRRQTLSNNLRRILKISEPQSLLTKAQIPALARAETLAVEDWVRLGKLLEEVI